MNTLQQLRALVDGLNKQKASNPTGGDGRMNMEAKNTAAIARGQAMDRNKLSKMHQTMPLHELQRKC